MSELENKNLEQTPQEPPQEPQEPKEAPAAPTPEPAYEKPTPHLTLEPDLPPEPPVYEATTPQNPGSAAAPFHMPEPPRAPEPQPYEPQKAQPQSNYNGQYQQEPQYQPPQYQYQPPQPQQPYYNYTPQYNTPPAGYVQKSRLAAGLLAIMLGVFGVHNFYLGFNTRGTIQLILSLAGGLLTCGVATIATLIWSFIEGVMILSAQPSRMYDGNGVILRD